MCADKSDATCVVLRWSFTNSPTVLSVLRHLVLSTCLPGCWPREKKQLSGIG